MSGAHRPGDSRPWCAGGHGHVLQQDRHYGASASPATTDCTPVPVAASPLCQSQETALPWAGADSYVQTRAHIGAHMHVHQHTCTLTLTHDLTVTCCHTFYACVDSYMFTDAHAMTKHRQHVYVCSHRHTNHCGLLKPYPADTLTCRNTHGRARTRPGAVVLAKSCGEKRSNSSPRHDVGSAGHPVFMLFMN